MFGSTQEREKDQDFLEMLKFVSYWTVLETWILYSLEYKNFRKEHNNVKVHLLVLHFIFYSSFI
jgi:hypothetical protein